MVALISEGYNCDISRDIEPFKVLWNDSHMTRFGDEVHYKLTALQYGPRELIAYLFGYTLRVIKCNASVFYVSTTNHGYSTRYELTNLDDPVSYNPL